MFPCGSRTEDHWPMPKSIRVPLKRNPIFLSIFLFFFVFSLSYKLQIAAFGAFERLPKLQITTFAALERSRKAADTAICNI